MNSKICTKCKELKTLAEFYKNGKESSCKKCYCKRTKNYLYPNRDAPRGQKSSDARKKTQATYREKNREKIRAGQRLWVKNNLPKVLARTHKYQAAKLNATPKWLTNEHLKQIEDMFIKAKNFSDSTGIKHEVDHQVPLCGENVRGLHVPWNLKILERSINRKKHNKY